MVAVLHHHVDRALALVEVCRLRGDNLLQPHNVLMVEDFEDLDLSYGGDGKALFLIVHPHPLERHNFAALLGPGLVNLAVCALPDLLHLLVELDRAGCRLRAHPAAPPVP
eukprot:scaffold41262_cov31-Tisochrysis_lutea.AAC.1